MRPVANSSGPLTMLWAEAVAALLLAACGADALFSVSLLTAEAYHFSPWAAGRGKK